MTLTNKITQFTLIDTMFFKGIGIFMIFIHNYLHIIPGFGIENERSFDSKNLSTFLYHFNQFSIEGMIASLFGFLGHYGVQIFIFFSAYGLSIQYSGKQASDIQFIFKKIKKLYFLMFYGILFTILFYALIGIPFSLKEIVQKLFLLTTSLSSFSNFHLYKVFAGPFWFFALMIQLYLLFPFIYKLVRDFINRPLLLFGITYLMIFPLFYFSKQIQFNLLGDSTYFNVFGNIIGHLPEVFLGVFVALSKKTLKPWAIFIVIPLFILTQWKAMFFPFSFLLMTFILIQIIGLINKHTPSNIKNIILFTGRISMILFIVNGPLRRLNIFLKADGKPEFWMILLFIPILYLISYLLFLNYSFLTKKLKV